MRIEPSLVRIRAVVTVAAINLSVVASVISRTVVVPYMKLRFTLGNFFKYKTLSDTVSIADVEPYFAEDYVVLGYVSVPFFISFGKNVTDPVYTSDSKTLRATKSPADSVAAFDVISLALLGRLFIVDPVSASDTGSLQMQDYCGIDYFAEDYLGSSRTFS